MNIPNLIKRSISGDRAAQKELYLQYCDLVMSIAIRYTNDVHQAKDVVQNTFIKVFQSLDKYDDKKSQLSTWIYTITVREAIGYIRENKKWIIDESVWNRLGETIEEQIDNSENIEAIKSVIENLPELHRTILMMYYYDELSHKEIADILGIKEVNSRSRLYRAKEELKTQLKWSKI